MVKSSRRRSFRPGAGAGGVAGCGEYGAGDPAVPGRGHREVQIPEDGEGNSLLDTFESLDERSVPDKTLDNEETRRIILALVGSLPDAQRQCVLMFYYGELGNQIPARDPDARSDTPVPALEAAYAVTCGLSHIAAV